MKKLILAAALSFLAQISFCQGDYVVTVKGDTLYGKPTILSYDLVDRVQIKVNKSKKSFTALEVKSIFIDNQTYHSVRHESRYEFMLLVKSGYLSLYGFRVDKQFGYDGRFLLKRDGGAMEVPNLGFKKSMQDFLKDCETMTDQLKNGDLGRKNLDSLITVYNDCIDQKTKQITSVAPPEAVVSNPSLPELDTLREKIEKSQLSSRQDVLDLLRDIDTKTKSNQAVPNYLIEGLKGYLENTEYKEDLGKLITVLNK